MVVGINVIDGVVQHLHEDNVLISSVNILDLLGLIVSLFQAVQFRIDEEIGIVLVCAGQFHVSNSIEHVLVMANSQDRVRGHQ